MENNCEWENNTRKCTFEARSKKDCWGREDVPNDKACTDIGNCVWTTPEGQDDPTCTYEGESHLGTGETFLVVLGVVAVVAVGGVYGWYYWNKKRSKNNSPEDTPKPDAEDQNEPAKGTVTADVDPANGENRTDQSESHGSAREGDKADTDAKESYARWAYNGVRSFGNGVLQTVGLGGNNAGDDGEPSRDDTSDPEHQTSGEEESSSDEETPSSTRVPDRGAPVKK